MSEVKLALIVAAAENGTIGRDNQLPWHLPGDLAFFKRCTLGKPIVMGRKTFDSIGRPLPGRPNIVVTRQADWQAEGVTVCNSLEQALAVAGALPEAQSAGEVMVIGGAELYRQALPMAQRLYLTRVHATIEGDAHFPAVEKSDWLLESDERHSAEGSNPYDYSFIVLSRT
ncbi:type 3 dihydrofolate reductase [Simiduia agarivorans]|uniref:Dihydrofolate reductase n=1 Tax=Simiduia agarivorans (strain DSM 21679 / JCM 13881 / BCRC 17597 / SA1) TaxID=1117647 RepID=K4KLF7_SIMAS|nr:type 3 dihydrofolate reductase [Simiduia agarivorans]AFU99851.1 dihydrofolate reductase [Simiduia agarivorans SA1 = DSM 21679]